MKLDLRDKALAYFAQTPTADREDAQQILVHSSPSVSIATVRCKQSRGKAGEARSAHPSPETSEKSSKLPGKLRTFCTLAQPKGDFPTISSLSAVIAFPLFMQGQRPAPIYRYRIPRSRNATAANLGYLLRRNQPSALLEVRSSLCRNPEICCTHTKTHP